MDVKKHNSALSTGDTLKSYRIERLLGRGGFGVTYLALDTNLEMQVAIKEYLPAQIASRVGNNSVRPKSENQNEAFRWGLIRFIKEARTLAKFRHKNIVRVMSVFEANHTAYMVMEYERGKDLKTLLRQPESKTEAYLKNTMGPIIDGLSEVHSRGYIHRDIKPANLLIREDGTPVLLDFGSARQTTSTKTQALTALVTVGYAPLEQYNKSANDQQGPWTDIYGLGAVLYYAISGSAPVDSALRGSAILNDRPDPLTPLTKLMPEGYSREFLKAIDWALSFKVAERPQTLAQWRAVLLADEPDRTVARQKAGRANAVPEALSIRKVAIATPVRPDRSRPEKRSDASLADKPSLRPVGHSSTKSLDDNRGINVSTPQTAAHDWDVSGVADTISDRVPVQRSRRKWLLVVFPVIGLYVAFLGWQSNGTGETETASGHNPLLADTQSDSKPATNPSAGVRQSAALSEQHASTDTDKVAATADQAELTDIRIAELAAARAEAAAKKTEQAAMRKAEQEAELATTAKNEREAEARRQAALDSEREAAVRKAELAASRQAEQVAAAIAEREAQARKQAELAAQQASTVEAVTGKTEITDALIAEQNAATVEREANANTQAALATGNSSEATAGSNTADHNSSDSRAIRLISDVDINLVAMRFRELGDAIRSKDMDAVRRLARPTEGLEKFEYLTYVFGEFNTIELSIQDLQASPRDQTIKGTLRLDRLIRPDGSGVLPPANFREFQLRSVRQGEWSEVMW